MSLLQTNDKKRVSRKTVQGEILLKRLFERDTDKGAYFLEILGVQGCGKTSLMLGLATKMMNEYINELIFWREPINSPCQFPKIGNDWQLLTEKRYPLEIREITNNLELAPIKMRHFRGFKELLAMAKPSMINIVYFKDLYRWIDFLAVLRTLPEFQTVFWDEYEDICPQRCRGIIWNKNDELSNTLKQLRKSRVNLIANTQSSMDADFRIRSKKTHTIYLYGARVDKLSPIRRQAVSNLRVGSGWIDHGHSLFGLFKFPPYTPKEHVYVVQEKNTQENSVNP